jgi:NADPH-dependent glutamate synthase beta subunit-like oxidoreductase/NAD(P)H-flavin reductase
MLNSALGLTIEDLYRRDGLQRLDDAFVDFLGSADADLRRRLQEGRAAAHSLDQAAVSALMLALAPYVEDFLADVFGIRAEAGRLAARHHTLAPLYACKRLFVQRRAMRKFTPAEAERFDGEALEGQLLRSLGGVFDELAFANAVARWEQAPEAHAEALELASRYAAWAALTAEGKRRHQTGVLFKAPEKRDAQHLVPLAVEETAGARDYRAPPAHLRRRDGFALTDGGTDLKGALDEAHYCIWCHNQGKDSCSRGLPGKGGKDAGDGAQPFRRDAFGLALTGCPLEERISEFQQLKAQGLPLAALAVITVDNPMAAATGHRICNDCMRSCIYQRQRPVDIPQCETRTLRDVLALPFGFEIYSLLTRWNPMNLHRPYPKAATGRRVLVVGMGPAGFTLAHHLLNDGHTVVGIDGLKIEPLPAELCGLDSSGARAEFRPVRAAHELEERLDDRVMAGFGGVAEYGITVRWDKNFLKLIRLMLERRREFALFGGVRFGGTITLEDAFALGFDHVALAVGAGRPTVLDLPNGLARGVRTASDFLMALQLTGAAKHDSVTNLEIRLPVVVIGGGLTAIDAATEALAYYPVQVEKFLQRYETLVAERGAAAVRATWNVEEAETAETFLAHARAIRAERQAASGERREVRLRELLEQWGGVTIAYRRRLLDSPAYTVNHEEVAKALEEGVRFAEALDPRAVEVDAHGHAAALRLAVMQRDEVGTWRPCGERVLPAATILVAAGTQPNTVVAREEEPQALPIEQRYFRPCDEQGEPVTAERANPKPDRPRVLLQRRADGRFLSYFGDVHPSYFGSVVKAMASAKQGYPTLSRVLERTGPASTLTDAAFLARLHEGLRARVAAVHRLAPSIVEVVVRAPFAARRFRPGQFYRLQNFAALAPRAADTTLAMEGLALTGASVEPESGLISTIALEMGGSSDLCASLSPGEPVVLMGPTGTPTDIPSGVTVALLGGGLGNAVLFSIGAALRAAGSRVLYFAAYRTLADRYKVGQIEKAADVVVWCCEQSPGFEARREQDRSVVGNVIDAVAAYAAGALGPAAIRVEDVDRIIAIGSQRMMAAVARARSQQLRPYLKPHHVAIGSINSPMQCMMKEICGSCLQPLTDPATGETVYVFSCFNQDLPLERVDFDSLDARLRQNSTCEKLTRQWIDRCLRQLGARPAAGSGEGGAGRIESALDDRAVHE